MSGVVLGMLLILGVVIVVLSYRLILFCPDREAEEAAALKALWHLPSSGFPPTREGIARMVTWASETQAWLDAQDFDPCTRKAYQGWINHVGRYRVKEATRDLQKLEKLKQVQQRPEFSTRHAVADSATTEPSDQ